MSNTKFFLGKDDLFFEEESHIYTNSKGEVFTSASTLIKKYSPPFDPDGSILKRKAAQLNISEAELQAEWDKKKVDGCRTGHVFHKQVEQFINTRRIPEGPDKDIIKQFKKFKFSGKLFSEVRLYDDDSMVAGTTDLIHMIDDNTLDICDFKTNKKLSSYNPWGHRMLFPIDYLYDTDFNKYSLQLSLYAYLLEKRGWWIRDLTIFYINMKKRKIEIYPLPNRRKEIIKVIDHHINNQ